MKNKIDGRVIFEIIIILALVLTLWCSIIKNQNKDKEIVELKNTIKDMQETIIEYEYK